MKTKITILLFGTASFLFITNVSKAQGFSVSGTNTYTNPLANLVGIGTTTPLGTLDVLGASNAPSWTYLRGNVNATKPSTSFNLGGLAIGWNYTAGGGEVDFVSNKSDGTVGGFRFQDWTTGGSGTITDLVTIKGNGNVGIGTTAPSSKLNLYSTVYPGVDYQQKIENGSYDAGMKFGVENTTNGAASIQSYRVSTSSADILLLNPNGGNVGIGTTSPSQLLTVYNGTTTGTYTTSGWAHSSDARLKTNVRPIEGALKKVKSLNGVDFNWKNKPDSNNQIGFIAQDVEKIIPEVVVKDTGGNYSMVYGNLTAVLVEAIKELAQKDSMKDIEIQSMKNFIEQLQTAVKNSGSNNLGQLSSNTIQLSTEQNLELSDVQSIVLQQNLPNPFAEQTSISYYLPDNIGKAQILFYNAQGKLIQSTEVIQKGKGTLNVFASDLSNGIYTYTLVVDGKIIETKKMVKQ